MQILFNILKGMVIGVANIIPGVSGGTMAVSLGIYERLINSITTIRKEWRKNIIFLVTVIIGMGIGIVAFSKAIDFLLKNHALPTALAFIGLVLGGIPLLLVSLNGSLDKEKKRFGASHVITFIIFCAIVLGMALLNGKIAAGAEKEIGFVQIIILFFMGVIASATMVIPGVSGSMMLMVFGYYDTVITTINKCMDAVFALDFAKFFECCVILVPFGIGVIVGIVAVAKLIDFLFKRFASLTFSAILGLVAASPGAIIINTKAEYGMPVTVPGVIIGAVLLVVCFGVTCWFGTKAEKDA